jgi:hypothetical protein
MNWITNSGVILVQKGYLTFTQVILIALAVGLIITVGIFVYAITKGVIDERRKIRQDRNYSTSKKLKRNVKYVR